jgi:hypothetical protein
LRGSRWAEWWRGEVRNGSAAAVGVIGIASKVTADTKTKNERRRKVHIWDTPK